MNSPLLISLLLAHTIADFYLQNDKCCAEKDAMKIKSRFLYAHAGIVGAAAWALVPELGFTPFAALIALSHLAIDAVKAYRPKGLQTFAIDQAAHLAVLALVAAWFSPSGALPVQFIDLSDRISLPLFTLAILLSAKPTNILIKLVLQKYKVGEAASCDNIRNAGALIGNLERILTITFVIIGQYEAIGFIIAAKSILRLKDTDTAKTEYVLAGTFLSFGIALFCGLLATL